LEQNIPTKNVTFCTLFEISEIRLTFPLKMSHFNSQKPNLASRLIRKTIEPLQAIYFR
jgi:hypothetical protein